MSTQQAESAPPPNTDNQMHHEERRVQCVSDLYLQAKFANVWFSIVSDYGTVTRIPAHKLLLAMASDVFEAIFQKDLKRNDDIIISDASDGAFKEFLQFFYRGEVKLTSEHIGGVMYLGQKYNVPNCLNECVEYLNQTLTYGNVCVALSLALHYNCSELTMVCENLILSNTAVVFAFAGFLDSSKEALAHILKMDVLSCSESDVFEACMAWVRARSKQNTVSKEMVQEHLGNLFYQIRFVSMTLHEFCALEAKYGEVLKDDFHALIRLIAKAEKESERFNTTPRQIEATHQIAWDEDVIICCDRELNQDFRSTLNAEEKVVFSTNTPLLLGSFECCPIHSNRIDSDDDVNILVEVEITETRASDGSNAKLLSKLKERLTSEYTLVSLPQTIVVRPGFLYTICVKGFPEGQRAQFFKSLPKQMSDIEIKFHDDTTDGEAVNGLVTELNFNKI